MFNFKSLWPEGLVRLLDYRRRFSALNLAPSLSFCRRYRNAIEISNIEMVPVQYRDKLRCVVDVGANEGDWSIAIALLTSAEKIIAFEPIPEVFGRLKNRTESIKQIQCIQSALGSYIGNVTFNVEKMHQLSSALHISNEGRRLYGIEHERSNVIEVPITTLDEDLQDYDEITLLKVDVQGYDREVIKGAGAVLKRTRVLMIEILYSPYYDSAMSFDDLYKLVTLTSNMRLWGISEPHCSPVGKPIWADAIFINDKI